MENNWYDNSNNAAGNGNGGNNYPPYRSYYQPDSAAAKGRKHVSVPVLIVCLLVVALLASFASVGAYRALSDRTGEKQAQGGVVIETPGLPEEKPVQEEEPVQDATPTAVKPDGTASAGLSVSGNTATQTGATVEMIQSCMASAVGITTKVDADKVYSSVYGYSRKEADASGQIEYGSGSGIILTADGYIVTCEHVVAEGDSIFVCLQDGTEYPAQLVGKDAQTDIAVLKIDGENLPAATLGNSNSAVVGETVYAVGNPLGEFICSVSTGIISGLNRTLELDGHSYTLMQTDAAVNPGNSGGGLFSAQGELIGVVNAKTSSVGVEGLGFAIPIDSIKGIISDLMDLGYVSGRPYLGVTLQDVYVRSSSESKNPLEGYFGYGYTTRTQVVTVEKGSAAEKGGVVVNDVITTLDGKEVSSAGDLTSMLYEYKVGDTITLSVLRGTESVDLKITLGERSATA